MIYTLHELLGKMGAPEAKEKGRIEWHYFNEDKTSIAGRAEIRLEAGGERLIAEINRTCENFEDDEGKLHAVYDDRFYLAAERTARPDHYRITMLTFDGIQYERPTKAVIELGLSIFHARALDTNMRMVEQTFNKQDIVEPAAESEAVFKNYFVKKRAKKETAPTCVVIPFPTRPVVTASARR